MKKWKNENFRFLPGSRGAQGRKGQMDACDAFCCIRICWHLWGQNLFYFGINNKVAFAKILIRFFYFTLELFGMWWWMWWRFRILIPKIFLFTSSGYDMAPTRDLDTKNYLVSKTSTSESKISDIWPTLRHVWDMSKTFPTKKPCLLTVEAQKSSDGISTRVKLFLQSWKCLPCLLYLPCQPCLPSMYTQSLSLTLIIAVWHFWL